MFISPFTPLFFIRHKTDGIQSEYVQTFAPTDRILIQLLHTGKWEGNAIVYDEPARNNPFMIDFMHWDMAGGVKLTFTELSLSPGCYSVHIDGIGDSEPIIVTDDQQILNETTLIQYSMKDNRQRTDAVFFIDGMQYFFDFRVPGGFKDSDWTFGCESEQFMTSTADIAQLFGLESTQKKFTLGNNVGVPVWFGEMLNRLLVCSHVYFDGVKYSRKDSNVPELNIQLEGINSFVFSQALQQSRNLDPLIEMTNQAIIRRVDTDYRTTDGTITRLIY